VQARGLRLVKFLRMLLAWLLAAAVTAVTGSVVQSQFNLAAIAAIGAPVSFGARLQVTLHDLVHFAPTFGLISAAGFLVAFLVAALLVRRRPARRTFLYTLAGAAAIVAAIGLMNAMLPVTAIGAARSWAGILALALTGALGGWSFARVSLVLAKRSAS
jgi:hypothetical protein